MTLKTKNTLATYNVYFNETSDITFKGYHDNACF